MIEIIRLSLPITIWLTGFSAVYALQGLTCSRHWPPDIEPRPVLIAAWALSLALQAFILLAIIYQPSPSRFVRTTAFTLAVAAVIACVWTMLPLLATSVCG